ncbi:OmpA family protein [Nitrobacter winogradskyi]|nr:OmpA family protein [Nitrobacter winogradskyi]
MTHFRLLLLATSALTLSSLTVTPSQAQSGPVQFAQATPSGENGDKDKRKGPPKAAPDRPAASQPAAAPPHARPKAPKPPTAAPPRPAIPPAAPPSRPTASPQRATPPAAPETPRAAPSPQPATPPAAPKPPAPSAVAPPSPPKGTPPAAMKPAPATSAPIAPPQATRPTTPPAGAEPNAMRRDEQGRGRFERNRGEPGGPGERQKGAAPAPKTTPAAGSPSDAPKPAPANPPVAAPAASPSPNPNGTKAGSEPPTPASRTARPAGAPRAPQAPPTVTAPLPPPPPVADKVVAPGAAPQGPRRIEDFRSRRQETQQGGRTIITEPGRVIVRDPSGQSFIRHNESDRFRRGARDIRQERVGNDTRNIVVRQDGTQIITVNDRDGRMLQRIRRDPRGQEIVIIDNRHPGHGGRGGALAAGVAAGIAAGAIGSYFVSLPPPQIGIPPDRYIVEAEGAPPEVIYDTLMAPPVESIQRPYTLDEVRYSPMVRARMPSIDLDTINFETGSWDISDDQAAKLQVIADGINRVVARNPGEVFLIEGHTDAVGNDVDNLSLSDRRAQSAAELLTQQFQVPPENLVTQGYGEQNLKIQTDGPSRENRRVTVRRITPLLNGGQTAGYQQPPN